MNTIRFKLNPIYAALLGSAALLSACGGGSDDDTATPPAGPASLTGTAAIGAALAKANVEIRNKDGAVCTEQTIVTLDTGTYTCTLLEGKTAPFTIVVTDPSGAVPPMVSIGTETPQSGTPLVVNVTPLTTAIVAQLSANDDALAVAGAPASIDTVALQSLQAITAKVLAQLADVLSSVKAPADYSPFTSKMRAATASVEGDLFDQIVDVLKISTVNGQMMIATVDKPELAVAVAAADTVTPQKVAAPSAGVASLSESLKLLSAALTECFKGVVADRVLARDTTIPANDGGPMVTTASADCEDITHANYLNNGYNAGQNFYGLLTDDRMNGATFSLPELVWFIPAGAQVAADRALINIRYTDKNGNARNMFMVAQKFPGTATAQRNTDWWIYGNQRLIDASVQPRIIRREQLAPAGGVFALAATSRFETALNFFINKDGPNSANMRAVRITGPALPAAGLVYTRPDPALALDGNWMALRRKDGQTDPASATYAGGPDNAYRLQRTQGLTGTDAATVRPNPNAGNSNNMQYINWAHPADYGRAPGSTGYVDFSVLRPFAQYQFEVFYDGQTAPTHTFTTSLVHAVVPATQAAALQWVDLTPQTRNYLDPSHALAASTTSMTLAWTANPLAEQISSAGVYTGSGAGQVSQGLVDVVRGDVTGTANAPTNGGVVVPFPALTNDGTSWRQLQLRYRMMDGSYKESFTQFN